jgi:threonine/homoserine/homoserine lactone efflux protein
LRLIKKTIFFLQYEEQMNPTTFLSFLAICLIIEATPGPNMAYLAILSITEGKRAAFAAIAGVATGLLIIGIVAALGVAALIASSDMVYQLLRWAGVFYMLWLAWDGWGTESTLFKKTKDAAQPLKFFQRGLMTNLLNPKAMIFYISVLPQFINTSAPVTAQAISLSLVYVTIATLLHIIIVVLASTAHVFLENPRHNLLVRRVLSLLLAMVAIWIAWETGSSEL